MSALSADRNTKQRAAELSEYPVAASTTVYSGSLVCINTSGYAIPAANTAGYKLVGIAQEQADNSSGSNGDISVKVKRVGAWSLTSSGLAITDEGAAVYVSDDQTVSTTPGHVFAGVILDYVSATEAWVDIEPATRPAQFPLSALKLTQLNTATMTDNVTLTNASATVQFLDPDNSGSHRTVTLPAEAGAKGLAFIIANTGDDSDDLAVKEDAGSTTIVTISDGEMGIVVCDGTSWKGLVAATT